MIPYVLSVLRKAHTSENADVNHHDHRCVIVLDEEQGSPGLKKDELRDLFHVAFVEMDRDLPKRRKKKAQSKST